VNGMPQSSNLCARSRFTMGHLACGEACGSGPGYEPNALWDGPTVDFRATCLLPLWWELDRCCFGAFHKPVEQVSWCLLCAGCYVRPLRCSRICLGGWAPLVLHCTPQYCWGAAQRVLQAGD